MNNAAELLRLITNLIRIGTIAEVDYGTPEQRAPAVRVKSGDLLTRFLPWVATRAGITSNWNPPSIGEQVIVLSPGGDLATGVVLTGLYQAAHPSPSNEPSKIVSRYPDEGLLEYDHQQQLYRLTVPGRIEISADGGILLNGDLTHQGNAKHNGDMSRSGSYTQSGGSVNHDGKNIGKDHTHSGVESGPGNTGVPN